MARQGMICADCRAPTDITIKGVGPLCWHCIRRRFKELRWARLNEFSHGKPGGVGDLAELPLFGGGNVGD